MNSKNTVTPTTRENIKTVINRKGLSLTEVAKKLYPTNYYAYAAFNRFLKGDCNLKSEQLSELSKITGISLEELCSRE